MVSPISSDQMSFQVAVIGAGPAGLAAVGRLLDAKEVSKVLWIDPSLESGRLDTYSRVPRYLIAFN